MLASLCLQKRARCHCQVVRVSVSCSLQRCSICREENEIIEGKSISVRCAAATA